MRMRVLPLGLVAALALVFPAVSLADPPPDGVVADGVSVQGVPIGGLSLAQARSTVLAQVAGPRLAPLRLVFDRTPILIKPQSAGYGFDVDATLALAMEFGRTRPLAGPVDVPLDQWVDGARLRTVLAFRADRVDTPARDAQLRFRGAKPRVLKARMGRTVDVSRALPLVVAALKTRSVAEVRLPTRRVRPAVLTIGSVVVVNRADRRLTLYRGERAWRVFKIAVGTPSHPTPRGLFRVIEKQRNPTWFPPDSPWAAGLGPVPPGASNPLGTRWIGTSAPAIGIHGTPASWSIGTAASHGCIRMYINQVEWLYERVRVGTPVLIV